MDIQATNKLRVIRTLSYLTLPIRVPTACWLFSDLHGWVDSYVREVLKTLEDDKVIQIDNGGWIRKG